MEVEPSPTVRLAMAQMRVVGGDVSGNLARAVGMIEAAAEKGADVVLLPETLDVGWTHPSARELAGAIPDGPAYSALAEAARSAGLHVCAGLTERAGDRVHNAAVLIAPDGAPLLHHRKLNELEIGHSCYDRGDRLGVTDTPLGAVGLMICADAFVDGHVVGRTLGLMGAQIILSPCAWAVTPEHDNISQPYGQIWRDSYGAVAREFGLWIAGVSNVGRIDAGAWEGRKCIGCSLLMGPEGSAALTGPYGEEAEALLVADLAARPNARRCSHPHRA